MGKLHEVLAAEAALGETARRIAAEAIKTFNSKAPLFTGALIEVEPMSEAQSGATTIDATRETQLVQATVDGKLQFVREHLANHWDAIGQKEVANTEAKSYVEIDGERILDNVPATFLLPMEKQLAALRTVVLAAPTANGAIAWSSTEWPHVRQAPRDHRIITHKLQRVQPVHEPTEHQQGTHQVFTEDVPVGRKFVTLLDGNTSSLAKSQLLARIDTLLVAVRQARARANMQDVTPHQHGTTILDWIFAQPQSETPV